MPKKGEIDLKKIEFDDDVNNDEIKDLDGEDALPLNDGLVDNNNNNIEHIGVTGLNMPTNYALPQGTVDFESKYLDTLICKRQVQGMKIKKASGPLRETSTNTSRPVSCVGKAGLR